MMLTFAAPKPGYEEDKDNRPLRYQSLYYSFSNGFALVKTVIKVPDS